MTKNNTLRMRPIAMMVSVLSLSGQMAYAEENTQNQTLPEVNVKTQRVQDAPNKGYQATKTRVGKTYQDPQDVPQAVTTLTRELLHDQQVGSLREALRNVVGLSVNAAEGGRAGDNFNLRGFYTFGDIYLDNMRDTAQYNRETFNLEQIDILRGSAAMLFGRGQAGGVINQVSKMAELHDKNTISGSLGEYDYHQFTGDFNKQLTETAAIRVNVMDRYEETFRKNPTTGDRPAYDRKGIAISFGAGIGTENEFFLNHLYTQTRDIPDFGIRFANGRPLSSATNGAGNRTFWGDKNNFDDSDTRITTGIFTHKFSDDTQLRTQIRHANYQRGYWAKTPATGNPPAFPTVNSSQGGNITRYMDYETYNLQSDFSTKFDLIGMKHTVLTGAEYLKEQNYRTTLIDQDSTTGANFDRHNYNRATPNKFNANNYAVYVQDSIEFIPNWTVLAGIRRDEMKADYSSLTSPHLTYGENSYRTGLSWQPIPDRHYYVSYSDSFSPTADLYQLTTTPLPPERSKTIESGIKWLFFDGDLSVRTAIYRAEKNWERNQDLESTAALLSKKRHTNGIEFEVAGKVTDNWDVFGGLALMEARIDEQYDGTVIGTVASQTANGTAIGAAGIAGTGFVAGTNTNALVYRDRSQQVSEGERPRNTPIATFNLWTTYKFLNDWKAGVGVEAKAERIAYGIGTCNTVSQVTTGTNRGRWQYNACSSTFNPNMAPGYARVDASLEYSRPKWAVRLNIKNLLNKEYYDAVYDNGGLVTPGNKRQAIITTEYKF